MSTAVAARITPAEYLALERKAEFKSEYIDGEIRPTPGVSRWHSLIVINLVRILSTHFLGRPGEVHANDMRVHVGPAGLYTYPDVVLVAGEPRLEDDQLDTLLNPDAIIEVLSPSTEAYDRGEKFERYRRCESLREYVLVSQDRVLVERYRRQGEDWIYTALDGLDDVLRLESIACDVPLRPIYAKTPLAEARP